MKLRATITVDIDAKDFKHASNIQEELESLCQQLRDDYGKVVFDIRERRNVKGRSEGQPGTRAKKPNNSGKAE